MDAALRSLLRVASARTQAAQSQSSKDLAKCADVAVAVTVVCDCEGNFDVSALTLPTVVRL